MFHASWSACHTGINCTLSLMKRHFWWSTMEAYVSACTVCACYKTSHWPPSGLLHPLASQAVPSYILPNVIAHLHPITSRVRGSGSPLATFPLHSRKLTPRYIGFMREPIRSALRLKLPKFMQAHPTFHVSQLKPVSSSLLFGSTSLSLQVCVHVAWSLNLSLYP